MPDIYFNDAICHIAATQSLHDFLCQHHCGAEHFAVAINNQFIPRAHYGSTILQHADRVDLIVPMQGG